MRQIIYADNAATTKLDSDAFEAMKPYLLDEYGNPSQPYFFSKKPKMAVKKARETIAECIGAEPSQIFFTSGGTESDNWAIKCYGCSPGDVRVIVTSAIEHHAVLNACKNLERLHSIVYLPVDKNGLVSPLELEKALEWSNKPVCSCIFRKLCSGLRCPVSRHHMCFHRNGKAF